MLHLNHEERERGPDVTDKKSDHPQSTALDVGLMVVGLVNSVIHRELGDSLWDSLFALGWSFVGLFSFARLILFKYR